MFTQQYLYLSSLNTLSAVGGSQDPPTTNQGAPAPHRGNSLVHKPCLPGVLIDLCLLPSHYLCPPHCQSTLTVFALTTITTITITTITTITTVTTITTITTIITTVRTFVIFPGTIPVTPVLAMEDTPIIGALFTARGRVSTTVDPCLCLSEREET